MNIGVAELKKLLSALIKGKGSFEQVNAAVQQYLERSPDKAALVAKLLKAARDAGLPHPMYVSLSSKVASEIATGPDLEATIFAVDDEPEISDLTVLPDDEPLRDTGSTSRAGSGGDAAVFTTGGDEAKTVLDSSRLADERAEILSPGAPAPGEATEMEAVLDDGAIAANSGIDSTGGNGTAQPDAAEINSATADPTSLSTDATGKTIAIGAGVDFDVYADEALASAETSDPDTGANWPTIRGQRSGRRSRVLREGDHLRNRFQLMSKLGEGGMGAVWKGKDLLKEEAWDRNPFVAIKLLQGDFKDHPEAFIALHRETVKQQRLAHPNIATVYDFDRDDSTNTVFMTMEVLEGQPLDAFIRKLPRGGLTVDRAMPLIEQLCNGLSYAHSHGLVHSDLKPGNCFYTKEGTIKLLDFGIARASKTKADADGETTLFNPSDLGALTPTYATIEMFEGIEPDPRDDIYALAIMTYQLLSGSHPYGKKAAPKARELGLKPEPISKLNKRQNKALMRGLAFEREHRTPTVEEFFDSIRPKKSRAPMIIAASLAAMAFFGVGAYNPVADLIKHYRREQIISIIEQPGIENIRRGLAQASALEDREQLGLILNDPRTNNALVAYTSDGGEKKISEIVTLIAPSGPIWQKDVREIQEVKSAIMNLYKHKIQMAFDVNEDRYDFATASALIADLARLYPDSAKVLQEKTRLNQEKAAKLAELSDDYTRYLDEGRLLPQENARDIGDVVTVVKQIDPEHPLLRDDRLRFRYGELAEKAIDQKAYGHADALLRASLTYAPRDSKLTDLRFRVQSELQRIANERRVAEIEQRLGPRTASLDSFSDFLGIRSDLIVLGDLSPDSKILAEIQRKLKKLFNAQMKASIARQNWEESERVLVGFSKFFHIPYVMTQRRLLTEAENEAGYTLEMTPERQAVVQERINTISELLAKPEFSSDWEIRLKVPYKELLALLPIGNQTLEQVRNQTARLYLQNAKSALESERFVEALAFIDRGRGFYPKLKNFNEFQQAIVSAQKNWRKRREEEQRIARIEALKNEFMAAADRNDIQDANTKLAGIRAEGVPADDPFLQSKAPLELANAYLRLAQGRVKGERPDLEQAVALGRKGLEVAPNFEELRAAVSSYEVEVKKRQVEIALRKLFESIGDIDVAATRASMEKLEADIPDQYPGLRKEFAETRANQILGLANSKDLRISSLDRRMDEYQALFPEEAPILHKTVASIVEKRIRAVQISSARDLEALSVPLTEFRAFSSKDYASLSKDLSSQIARQIRSLEKTDKFAAVALLEASIKQFGEDHLRSIDIELPRE